MNEGGVGLMVVGAAPRRVPASMRPPRVPASMEGLDLEAAKAIAAAATAAMDRTRDAKRQRVGLALPTSYYEAMGQQFWPDEEREEEEGEEEEGEEEDCKLVEAEAAEARNTLQVLPLPEGLVCVGLCCFDGKLLAQCSNTAWPRSYTLLAFAGV